VNYYPPCNTPEQVLGMSSHSDTGTITLLMQDDDVSGLEIRNKGKWVPINPISDAIVVNIGDVIEVFFFFLYLIPQCITLILKKKVKIGIIYQMWKMIQLTHNLKYFNQIFND